MLSLGSDSHLSWKNMYFSAVPKQLINYVRHFCIQLIRQKCSKCCLCVAGMVLHGRRLHVFPTETAHQFLRQRIGDTKYFLYFHVFGKTISFFAFGLRNNCEIAFCEKNPMILQHFGIQWFIICAIDKINFKSKYKNEQNSNNHTQARSPKPCTLTPQGLSVTTPLTILC